MLTFTEFMMITEMVKNKQEKLLQRSEEKPAEVKPILSKLSLMDRMTDSAGEMLISMGRKLKQHAHTRLTTEQAQAPNFMIML